MSVVYVSSVSLLVITVSIFVFGVGLGIDPRLWYRRNVQGVILPKTRLHT
jgi:hypothetical protein